VFLASLPWYDLPEVRDATDTFWTCLANSLRKRGFDQVPEKLDRELPFDQQWTSDGLLFSQACGYDVLLAYRSSLRLVGTPVYTVAGCGRAYYSSVIVVRQDTKIEHIGELRGSRCVINSPTSHSGMNVLRALFTPEHQQGRFFSAVLHSGSHEASLSMVADGFADVASIDRVTYALIERYRPVALRNTRVLCCSMRTPAPPYVTGSQMTDTQVEQIRQALTETLAMPSMKVAKEALLLDGVVNLPLEAYRPIVDLHRCAARMGYHEIPWLSFGHRAATSS
jgi:ABC-type phosphate/phosphonate transport system substrate-binding protein